MTYIAENVPWYMVDSSIEKPWRDEDVAMSAPVVYYTGDSEEEARDAMSNALLDISMFGFVKRSGESGIYVNASDFIISGGDGVRIFGRYYRIREV